MKDAGFAGVYHALRLREGNDSGLSPEKRKESIRNFQEAGLLVGTCVEPVGPEHTVAELADMILYTASINPAYSGAARRIPIPGTEIAKRGTITELRMAQIVAVTRLGMPRTVLGNCTHEPCTLGALPGLICSGPRGGPTPEILRRRQRKAGARPFRAAERSFPNAGGGAGKGHRVSTGSSNELLWFDNGVLLM